MEIRQQQQSKEINTLTKTKSDNKKKPDHDFISLVLPEIEKQKIIKAELITDN